MQVVSLADEFGNPVEFQDNGAWQTQMLDEMRAVRLGIQTLLDEGNQHKARQVNLLEWSQTIRSDEDY
jgi:type V secretory pathway adhesin AidA